MNEVDKQKEREEAERRERSRTRAEINDIIRQLHAVSRELDQLAESVGSEFKGIGSPMCASSLKSNADKYRQVAGQLSRI
ncbi:hypothetical protein DNH61_16550 [Paenibacillus sambharensis]|uniref:Uncharacterized protein n=1 Tax=Paenibacillus sambharensis TaxID=1803190 RepID=A0A2W1LT08_9BACL|nr:hypothetical protein [Paenibacillus sambharensis]PZD94577.1 hypothetical protein DNH61_16550 [Paenibacillus sambharensis]